jgi:hypothetical protein
MAIQYLSSINLTTNQLQYAVIQPATTDPTLYTPVEGQIYYNSVSNKLRLYDGALWNDVGAGVTSFAATDGTFINLTPNTTQTGAATLTADLSATGTPDSTVYLRGDNTWSPISAIPGTYVWSIQGGTGGPTNVASGTNITFAGGTNVTTALVGNTLTINATNANITLTGEVTGSGTTSITTTVADGVLDVANFNASAIVTASEGIPNNDNDTTLPTSAAVKAYVDASVAGGLIYQGGYNAFTNTPNLDSPPTIAGIKRGWTYTVIADGTFFTEQVRVGDVLIAEIDTPTTLTDWTVVQSNIDLASLTQVGIGNVNAFGGGIGVTYSNGTAFVSNLDGGSSQNIFKNIAVGGQSTIIADSNNDTLTFLSGTGITLTTNDTTDTITITATPAVTNYATTISATSTITHSLNTRDVNVQLYDTVTFETIFSDVARPSVNTVTITFATAPTNPIRVLVTKVG